VATQTLKGYRGLGMEGWIARWYTTNTGKDMQQYKVLAEKLAERLPAGSRVLEVAPGPGYLAIELAKRGGYHVSGLDISATFVAIAKKKAAEQRIAVDFRQGNAAAMPFADGSFDFLICRAAFKNFAQPVNALKEMCRVLVPGGRALIIDLRRDLSWRELSQAVDGMGMSAINRAFTKLAFRFMLIRRAYTKQEFQALIAQSGFKACEVQESGTGLEIELQK